jgi:ribonuclease HI
MKSLRYWKVIVSLLVVVVCSGAIGAAVALRLQNQRMARAIGLGAATDVSLDRLASTLALSPAQAAQIRPILLHGQNEIRALARDASVRAAQVARRVEQEIRPLLNPEQVQRLQQMAERRGRLRERWQNGERLSPEQREWLRERIEQRYGTRPNAEIKP